MELFAAAGVTFPPGDLLLRVFKEEHQIDVWASSRRGGPMTRVTTYEVCAMSGGPGPKRREGDAQVPEGFYKSAYFWPDSSFYLAANVGYPNALDRIVGGPRPGGEIMIHGRCASIGCLAMTDERMQELWVMGTSVFRRGDPVLVHIFPARDIGRLIADGAYEQHHAFWRDIQPGIDLFDADPRPPVVSVDPRGRYRVSAAGR